MIASRKLDRLQKAAEEMKKLINSQGRGTAVLKHVECNIRKEDQVGLRENEEGRTCFI